MAKTDDTNILHVADRKLPSFAQWITQRSPGTQADGFAELTDLALRSKDDDLQPGLTPDQRSFVRLWIGSLVAMTELCNMEAHTHGRLHQEIIATLPRAIGAAMMYALASACTDDAPLRDLAKIITEEFRAAAKTAADSIIEEREP